MIPFQVSAFVIAASLALIGARALSRRRAGHTGNGQPLRPNGVTTMQRTASLPGLQSPLLDALHDAVFSLSPDLRILTWNAAAERIYGYPAEAVLGKTVTEALKTEFATGESREVVYEELRANGHVRRDVIQVHRDGHRVLLEGHAVAIRDADGTISGYVMVNRDVSDRRRAEEALRDSEAKFRAAFHGAGIAILLLDSEHRILEFNRTFRDMLGYADGELHHRSLFTLIHPDDLPRVQADHRECASGRKDLIVGERRYLRRDGSYAHALVRASIVRDAARNYLYSVGLIEDVTQKKAMEAQLVFADRMASMGTLAAGVAHEINNPLAFILANIDYIAAELGKMAAPADLQRALEETREGAVRVREIVRDLKTFSRADGHCDAPLDIRKVLQSSINLTQNEIRHRGVLVLDLEEVPPVLASPHRLGQVFVNLLINAAQAIMDPAPDRHEIRVSLRAAERGRVAVEVSDTGRGIAPENMSRIFEPFFTTKPVGVGTGLGLSICHGIVTRMGGEIQVESRLGHGSTFRVLLPAAAAPAAIGAGRAFPEQGAGGGRILVVDDEPMVGSAVARTLGPQHHVTTVRSGHSALNQLQLDAAFDVVICDLMMPEMTGMELHEKLAAAAPALTDRMVFLTGGAFTPDAREFLDRIPNPRLEKPFPAEALREIVDRMLSTGGA